MESLLSLGIGSSALLAVLVLRAPLPGTIFVAGCAAYTLGRQALLRLRTERRRSKAAGPITAVIAAVILAISATGIFLAPPAWL